MRRSSLDRFALASLVVSALLVQPCVLAFATDMSEDVSIVQEDSIVSVEEDDEQGVDAASTEEGTVQEEEDELQEVAPTEDATPADTDLSPQVDEVEDSNTSPVITKRGWNQAEDGAWYWSDDGKTPASGWRKSGGAWYYLDPETYVMKASETFSDGKASYVATASGACPASKWVKLGSDWYLTGSSCALRSGWVKSGGAWYYLDPETFVMKASETFSDGKASYVATASGACPANKWVKLGSDWYLTGSSCALRSGWVKSGSAWYYLDPETFVMKESELFSDGGKTYIATASGACPANKWVKLGEDWYLTNGSCAVRTGWVTSGAKRYYLEETGELGALGKMVTGFATVGEALYHFGTSGVMTTNAWFELEDGSVGYAGMMGEVTPVDGATLKDGVVSLSGEPGWNSVGNDRFYVADDGSLLTGWQELEGRWYWFDPSTYMMARGIQTFDGHAYVFSEDGAWIDITGNTQLNYQIAAIMRDHTGLDLRACYDYVRTAFYYRAMDNWPSYSGWQRDYARSLVNSGGGNCYAFSGLFQYMAKACGYDAKVIQGWVIHRATPSKRGPHGWVEVYIDGQTYIVDPEMSFEWKMSNLYLFRYADTPNMIKVDYAYTDGVVLK